MRKIFPRGIVRQDEGNEKTMFSELCIRNGLEISRFINFYIQREVVCRQKWSPVSFYLFVHPQVPHVKVSVLTLLVPFHVI